MDKVVDYLLIVVMIVLVSYFGLVGRLKEMGLAMTACVLAALINNFDKIKWLKAPGIEAELKETVNKAYATKEELGDLIRQAEEQEKELEELREEINEAKEELMKEVNNAKAMSFM
jgi:hypothetical protein